METEAQMGRGRYLTYLILGLVLAIAMIGVGIWGIVGSNEPVLGWVMAVAGVAVTILAIVQLRAARGFTQTRS